MTANTNDLGPIIISVTSKGAFINGISETLFSLPPNRNPMVGRTLMVGVFTDEENLHLEGIVEAVRLDGNRHIIHLRCGAGYAVIIHPGHVVVIFDSASTIYTRYKQS